METPRELPPTQVTAHPTTAYTNDEITSNSTVSTEDAPSQDFEQTSETKAPQLLASQATISNPHPETPSEEVEPEEQLYEDNEYIETHDYFEPPEFYNSLEDIDYSMEEENSDEDNHMSLDPVSENKIKELKKDNDDDDDQY